MAKQTAQQPAAHGPRSYVVLEAHGPTGFTLLGVVKARNADAAIREHLTFDPRDLVAVPVARWTQRKDACLRNKPEVDMGEHVAMIDGQLALEDAA